MNLRLLLHRTAAAVIPFVCLFFATQRSMAQCGTPITVFPYTEGFETSDGGFTTGGTLSDWAWGTPGKTVITAAATGAKCWIVGGLSGNKYNDGEASWLQSPCFDFSGLLYPYISFRVFWEMERRFDGAGLQYSTNLGATWTNVGSLSDPVDCLNDNWFNFNPISGLNPLASVRDGWSGNIQSTSGNCQGGGGSGSWVTAQHTLANLAGTPNVIFRFIFGSGTVCNNYDGFAVDDIFISNAPPNNVSFSFSCVNSTTVDFINTSALCPLNSWNFGDLASGANNTSTLANPTHVFSAPGTYTITLTATGPANAPSTYIQTINILGLTTSVITNNNCFGDNNGSASVAVIPIGAAPFFYSWNAVPEQTTVTATGLAGGMYIVTVNAINSCSATAPVLIGEPAALSNTVNITQPGCGLTAGSATITVSGGTGPYTYFWSPSGGNGPTASGLTPGNYTVTVTDSKLCTEDINLTIATATPPNIAVINKNDASCFGYNDGTATVLATGGAAPYNYSWNTIPVQNNAMATNLTSGIYAATVTDNNGCTVATSVQINEPASGFCGEVYFPNAFTPDGNSRNEDFGPLGNIAAISQYLLLIYNRYGELVFYSRNPAVKWDGYYKTNILAGTYVWSATYTYKGQFKRAEQGSVILIR